MTINSSFGHRFGRVFGMFQLGGQMQAPYGSLSFASANYLTGTGGPTNALTLNDDFTIEMWINCGAQTNSFPTLIAQNGDWGGNTGQLYVCVSHTGASNVIALYNATLNGGNAFITGTTIVTDDTWHHITVERFKGRIKLYVDGIDNGSYDSNFTVNYNNFSLGTNPSDGGASIQQLAYDGLISNVRIIKGSALYQKLYSLNNNDFGFGGVKITVTNIGDVYLQFYNSYPTITDQLAVGTRVSLDWDGRSPNTIADIAGPLIDFPGNPYPGHLGYLLTIVTTTELPGNNEDYNIEAISFLQSSFNSPIKPLTAITGTQLLLNTTYDNNFLVDSSVNQFAITNNTNVTSSNFEPFTPNPPV